MSMPMKMVIAFACVVILVAGGIAITMGNSDVTTANNYFEELTQIIIESHYSEEVIERCIDEAAANGYTLIVTVEGGTQPGERKYAEAVFKYNYNIPMIGIQSEKTKRKIL